MCEEHVLDTTENDVLMQQTTINSDAVSVSLSLGSDLQRACLFFF